MITVILPTYNEAENIKDLIEAIEMELKDIEHEIVVVDDDSSDGTIEVVRELSNKYPIKLISRKAERGLGSAIITGLKIALSNEKVIKIVTMDADLSHDPRYLKEMLRKSEGLDILIGSRYVKHGRTENWSLIRRLISYFANQIVKLLFDTKIGDHTSNYRVYSRRAAEIISKSINTKHYEYQIGSLLIALDNNLKIGEFPIVFKERGSGKSKLTFGVILSWARFIVNSFILRTRIWKYLIVGGIGTAVNEGVLYLLIRQLGLEFASATAIEVSIVSNFMLNDIWTFSENKKNRFIYRFLTFHLSMLLGALANFLILEFSVKILKLDPLSGNLFGIFVGFLLRYYTSYRYVWRVRK
jgi:dolichol-phosphate mannosyltransferase